MNLTQKQMNAAALALAMIILCWTLMLLVFLFGGFPDEVYGSDWVRTWWCKAVLFMSPPICFATASCLFISSLNRDLDQWRNDESEC